MRNFSSFLLRAPFVLRSYVNWIRRYNYGHIKYSVHVRFFDGTRCKCICILVVSVHLQTGGMQSFHHLLFFLSFFLLFFAVLCDSFLCDQHSTHFNKKIYRSPQKPSFFSGNLSRFLVQMLSSLNRQILLS